MDFGTTHSPKIIKTLCEQYEIWDLLRNSVQNCPKMRKTINHSTCTQKLKLRFELSTPWIQNSTQKIEKELTAELVVGPRVRRTRLRPRRSRRKRPRRPDVTRRLVELRPRTLSNRPVELRAHRPNDRVRLRAALDLPAGDPQRRPEAERGLDGLPGLVMTRIWKQQNVLITIHENEQRLKIQKPFSEEINLLDLKRDLEK